MKEVVTAFLLSRAKAVIATLVAGLAVWLSQNGVIIEEGLQQEVVAILGGLIAGLSVYLVPNKK